jgi:hypothetical protein
MIRNVELLVNSRNYKLTIIIVIGKKTKTRTRTNVRLETSTIGGTGVKNEGQQASAEI